MVNPGSLQNMIYGINPMIAEFSCESRVRNLLTYLPDLVIQKEPKENDKKE